MRHERIELHGMGLTSGYGHRGRLGWNQKEGKQLLVMATCTNFKVGVTTVMKL